MNKLPRTLYHLARTFGINYYNSISYKFSKAKWWWRQSSANSSQSGLPVLQGIYREFLHICLVKASFCPKLWCVYSELEDISLVGRTGNSICRSGKALEFTGNFQTQAGNGCQVRG